MSENTNDNAILILSCLIVVGFGVMMAAWMIYPPSAQHSDLMSAMIGAAVTAYVSVINYWFGGARKVSQ